MAAVVFTISGDEKIYFVDAAAVACSFLSTRARVASALGVFRIVYSTRRRKQQQGDGGRSLARPPARSPVRPVGRCIEFVDKRRSQYFFLSF